MPYSPDAVLELYIIEPGSEDDVWGEYLNTNMRRLAEAGHGRVLHQFVPGDTSYTLNDTDYTGTESHMAILQPYGSISSDIEIIVPPRSHLWHISNGVTVTPSGSPWRIHIKTTAPSTPFVSLLPGENAIVFSETGAQGVFVFYRTTQFLNPGGSVALAANLDAAGFTITNLQHPVSVTSQAAPVSWVVTEISNSIATALAQRDQSRYPVGYIYVNAFNNTNPASLFGFGTWRPYGAGTLQLFAGVHTDPAGDTANFSVAAEKPPVGLWNIRIAQANLPPIVVPTVNPGDNTGGFAFLEASSAGGGGSTAVPVGSQVPIGNLPPISVVYAWVRTA